MRDVYQHGLVFPRQGHTPSVVGTHCALSAAVGVRNVSTGLFAALGSSKGRAAPSPATVSNGAHRTILQSATKVLPAPTLPLLSGRTRDCSPVALLTSMPQYLCGDKAQLQDHQMEKGTNDIMKQHDYRRLMFPPLGASCQGCASHHTPCQVLGRVCSLTTGPSLVLNTFA